MRVNFFLMEQAMMVKNMCGVSSVTDVAKARVHQSHDDAIDAERLRCIYTPAEEAKAEIWKRWNDEYLKKKVAEYLGGDIPEPLRSGPKAVLARSVISPSEDLVQFLKVAESIELEPIFFEHRDDKFTSSNEDKYFLGKMRFFEGFGKHGGKKIYSLKIIDFDRYDGRDISSMKTIWKENFLEFHHRILDETMGRRLSSQIFNISPWVKRNGVIATKFYPYYLALFLCYGVLSEIFFLHKEQSFINEVLLPSLDIVDREFSMKPIIMSMFPSYSLYGFDQDDANLDWMCYPISVANLLPVHREHTESSFFMGNKIPFSDGMLCR